MASEKIRNTQIFDLWKAAGFFHAAKPEASLDIGTDLRNFVSENPQTRIVQDSNGKLLSV